MSDKPIGVGIIGLGFMGRTHFRNYGAIPMAKVVAVADMNPDHLRGDWKDLSGTSGQPLDPNLNLENVALYGTHQDLLNSALVDVVDICLPTDFHHRVAIDALRKGKHVIIEKPMAQTTKQADDMIALGNQQGLVLMVAHPLRFWPSYNHLGKLLSEKVYGNILTGVLRRQCATPQWSPDLWSLYTERGGGVLKDMQIHDIDYAVSAFGLPTLMHANIVSNGKNQVALSSLRYGALEVAVESYWVDSKSYPFKAEGVFLCERGALYLVNTDQEDSLTIYPSNGEPLRPTLPTIDPYVEELKYFLECVKTGNRPEKCSPESSRDALKIAEDLLKSTHNA
ncbi:MAG: Gfo/Idh/MocA family oxidoreductase [Nanoarchaeota archaeon]